MSRSSLDRSLLEIIKDPDAGLSEDRLRLFIISLLCGQQLPDVGQLHVGGIFVAVF